MRVNMIEELKKTPVAKTDSEVKNLFGQLDDIKKQIADAVVNYAHPKGCELHASQTEFAYQK